MRHFAVVTAVALALLLSACASKTPVVKLYQGPDLPTAEVITVRVPVEVDVLMVNDELIQGGSTLFAFGSRDFHLKPGSYTLAAYYKELWQINADDHETVKSDPARYAFEGKAGDVFELSFDRPQSLEDARALAKDFRGYLVNTASGERVNGEPSGLISSGGFMRLVTNVTAVEQKKVSAVEPQAAASSSGAAAAAAGGISSLDLLKAHWNQADADERRAFIEWISQPAQ